jgi:precorrin-4/cobalt-precorrin-4 C11-methyltransferase
VTKKGPIVYFVGAGPGDPDLITVKGKRLLEAADVVVYAGSLVNPALLEGLKAASHDSAPMDLDQIIDVMKKAVDEGLTVVRLHTGDTALYSAISEQIERLRALGIGYEVIPGVSSAMAGAAILGQELTIPEISQTVIMTRLEGRTPVPAPERLGSLSRHKASMIIFLSVGMIDKVVEELREGYGDETPVAVIEKASWPDQRIIRGTLADIAARVIDAGIQKTALIYVGNALLATQATLGKESRLYHKDFTHGMRK